MVDLTRVRSIFTGFKGEPGVATMYFLDNVSAVASVRSFWAAVISQMPASVEIKVENAGDSINEANGDLTGAWLSPPEDPVTGGQAGAYAAPAGALVRWDTVTIADGHRLSGGTFVVPIMSTSYDIDGTLQAGARTQLEGAAADLVTSQSASFVVWHRPKFGPRPAGGGARPMIRPGAHGLVTGSRVADKVAILRSRRD